MKVILVLISLLLVGCANTGARFNSDEIIESPKTLSTVYFYRPSAFQGSAISFPIIANDIRLGELDNGGYTKIIISPGIYKFHSDTLLIDRISTFKFKAGNTYFIRVFIEMGIWVSSIRFTETYKDDALLDMRKSRLQL